MKTKTTDKIKSRNTSTKDCKNIFPKNRIIVANSNKKYIYKIIPKNSH